jgi:hypothetical protein
MLSITAAQYLHFELVASRRFERLAWVHVQDHFADRVAGLGDGPAQALLTHALAGAARLGYHNQPEALRYVNLVFSFGPNFPDGAGCEWAGDILRDGLPDGLARVQAAALLRETGTHAVSRA